MIVEYLAEAIAVIAVAIIAGLIQRFKKTLQEWGVQGDTAFFALDILEDVLETVADAAKDEYPELKSVAQEMRQVIQDMRVTWDDPKGSSREMHNLYLRFRGLADYASVTLDKPLIGIGENEERK